MSLIILLVVVVGGYFLYQKYQTMPEVTVTATGNVSQPATPSGTVGVVGGILNGLFPQVQEAEQTIANLVVVVAAWGLVIALELVLVIWLLARRR